MRTVVESKVDTQVPDKRKHCLAAALIARYCSISEAYLAASGKELADLLGPGDADWGDWQASRTGIRCARHSSSDTELSLCCQQADR